MKQAFIFALFLGFINESFSQTTDFTISLLLKYTMNTDLCKDLSTLNNLHKLAQEKDSCVYKCDLNSIYARADSIILTIGLRPVSFYDYKMTLEIRQYFNNLDSASSEYNEYYKNLIQEFNSDTTFYRYNLTKIKDLYSINYAESKIWKDKYLVDLIKMRSLYIWSNLYLILEKEHDKFIIFTRIN